MSLCVPCPVSQALQKTDAYAFEIHQEIDSVNLHQWEQSSKSYFMSYAYLKTIEETHKDRMGFRYVQIRKDGLPWGCAYFQVVAFEGEQLINYFPENLKQHWYGKPLYRLFASILHRIHARLLVSGNIFMTGENGFYPSGNLNDTELADLFERCTSELLRQDATLAAVLIPDLYEHDQTFSRALVNKSYRLLQEEPDMEFRLHTQWNTFEDYLRDFSSKYRVRCKKALSKSEVLECRDLGVEALVALGDQLHGLYSNVMQQADFQLGSLSPDYFLRQKSADPHHYHLFGYFHENRLVGFISTFEENNELAVHYTGIDYSVNKPLCLYQRMLYDMVKLGIEKRKGRLHFGRTAQEIKSTVGATPMPTHGLLKHRNRVINRLMKFGTDLLKSKNFVYRSPFKDEAED